MKPIQLKGETYYYLKDAAKVLNMTTDNLRLNFLKTGKIKASKFGKKWIISENAIKNYIDNNIVSITDTPNNENYVLDEIK